MTHQPIQDDTLRLIADRETNFATPPKVLPAGKAEMRKSQRVADSSITQLVLREAVYSLCKSFNVPFANSFDSSTILANRFRLLPV